MIRTASGARADTDRGFGLFARRELVRGRGEVVSVQGACPSSEVAEHGVLGPVALLPGEKQSWFPKREDLAGGGRTGQQKGNAVLGRGARDICSSSALTPNWGCPGRTSLGASLRWDPALYPSPGFIASSGAGLGLAGSGVQDLLSSPSRCWGGMSRACRLLPPHKRRN